MLWQIHRSSGRVEIRRSPMGRLLQSVASGVVGGLLGFIGAAVFFGIDWLGRSVSGVEVPPGYALTVGVVGVLTGFAFAFVTLLRDKTWIIDDEAGTLALRRRHASPELVEVSLDELRHFRLTRRNVTAVFSDGTQDVIARSWLFPAAVEDVAAAIAAVVPEKAISEG